MGARDAGSESRDSQYSSTRARVVGFLGRLAAYLRGGPRHEIRFGRRARVTLREGGHTIDCVLRSCTIPGWVTVCTGQAPVYMRPDLDFERVVYR